MNHDHRLMLCNTKDAGAVRDRVVSLFLPEYGESIAAPIQDTFAQAVSLFEGRTEGFQAVDTAYHDLEHTFHVVLCWSEMAAQFNRSQDAEPFCQRILISGIAACLYHDTGYIKESDDLEGTGAKHTVIHEKRSCDRSREFAERQGWHEETALSICRMISATGPRARLEDIPFADDEEKRAAQMLATADFLAQISDPKYPQKLPALFAEFQEASAQNAENNVKTTFDSLDALASQTASFWADFVLPRMKNEYEGVYRFLRDPYPDGPNPYVEMAEKNIALISEGKTPTTSIYRPKS